MRSLVLYSVLRLLAFVVPFGILMLFPIFQQLWWLAAIFAALIGLSLSILFLRRPLGNATQQFAARRTTKRKSAAQLDAEAEDAGSGNTTDGAAAPASEVGDATSGNDER